MNEGAVQISLDFELLWGVFESSEVKEAKFQETQKSILKVLDLFQQMGIQCTWATVGMLFCNSWQEWRDRKPKALPSYTNMSVNSYRFVEQDLPIEGCLFAPDLVQQILETPNQELATHTYSHYYCLEPGQTIEQFRADIDLALQLGREVGCEMESLVFPRNQFQPDYLKVCRELGIKGVRSNPDVWYWRKPNSKLLTKVARTADGYLPFKRKSVPLSKFQTVDGVLLQPASRFLRPHQSGWKGKILNNARTHRIKSEMTQAAKLGEVYHLWWHPHNFACNVEASLANLKVILEHFRFLRDEYGMESHSMKSLRQKWLEG